MVSDLEQAEATLSEQEWRAAAEEIVAWLLSRPGWIKSGGMLEYLPSRPPCLVDVAAPMEVPCQGTLIDASELAVYPASVEYRLDGSEDMDDYSSTSWRHVEVPTELEITGQPGIALTDPVVWSAHFVDYGDGTPEEIRRSIDIIESWRWPHALPRHDEPYVEHWHPGFPADYAQIDEILAERGWNKRHGYTDGDPIGRGWVMWQFPQPEAKRFLPTIRLEPNDLGYAVLAPTDDHGGVSYKAEGQLVADLDVIESWTETSQPRWTRPGQDLMAHLCPQCDQKPGNRCAAAIGRLGVGVHIERISRDLLIPQPAVPAPRPGQRPAGAKTKRKRR